jgi:hypothetical protein
MSRKLTVVSAKDKRARNVFRCVRKSRDTIPILPDTITLGVTYAAFTRDKHGTPRDYA